MVLPNTRRISTENENPQNADSKMQEDIMNDLGMSKDDISVDLPKCKQINQYNTQLRQICQTWKKLLLLVLNLLNLQVYNKTFYPYYNRKD
jgi:hypothetical protein